MSKHVHICGLFRSHLKPEDQRKLIESGDEIWTCNDWYRCYPLMMPNRLFNIHYYPHVNQDHGRFPGDWKSWYNKVISCGGRISVVEKIEGVDPEGQELLPVEMLDEFSMNSIGCSISLSICMAAYLEFETISLHAVPLRDDEYSHQLSFIMNAIDHCRRRGIEIINPYEDDWMTRKINVIDWKNVIDIDCGSLPHLVKYFNPQTNVNLSKEDLLCQTCQTTLR